MIFDKVGNVLGVSRQSWVYQTPEDLEIAKEFDPGDFWDQICRVVKDAIKRSKVKPGDLEAVSATSQRHGIILLDAEGRDLHGGPNIDARGAMTQYLIDESLGERYHEITGCWPPLMFSPARLSWFEEEEPEIFESVTHILPLCDWITFKLSGEYVTDLSSAGATGFLSVKDGEWSEEVASAVNVDLSILPEIRECGSIVGSVTREAAKSSGLPDGLPVILGGADTHCALLASDSKIGEIAVIAGSTAPVMMIIDDWICSPDQTIWTGSHMEKGQWVLESNATMTGANLEWVVNLLCEQSENPTKCAQRTFDELDDILRGVKPGSNDTYVAIGPSVMNARLITDVKQARIEFPQPTLPQLPHLDASNLIHAVIENVAYAIRGNVEQLDTFRQSTIVKTIGGMSRSDTWPQLLANVLNRPVKVPEQSEGSLLGAAMCAATGVGHYSSLQQASKTMVKWKPVYEPDDRTNIYQGYYTRWADIWHRGEQ